MGVNMSIPAAYDECLSQAEQLEWLYKHKENLLTAGANIKITRSGDTVIIAAEGEGFSPTVNVEVIPGGHRVTITDGEGPHVFDVMDGQDGHDGQDGRDGTSVSFSTQAITGGTRVTLTDGTHSSSFNVMNGTDGEDITITDVSVISAGTQVTFSDDTVIVIPNGLTGPQGLPGLDGRNVFIKYADEQPTQDSDMKDIPSAFMGVYSGTATSAPTTFTDYLWYQIKGTKGDTGSPGAAGQDGVSPTLSAEPISGGHRVTMTDAEGTTTFDVMDGENAAAATVTVGNTTTGEPGTNASVTNSGTSSDAVLEFTIPRGNPGPAAYVWTTDDDYTTPNYTFNISDLEGVSGETPKVGDLIFQNVNHRTFVFKINSVSTTTVLTDYFCEITGATGATGAAGQDGVTPSISATASVNSSTGTPSVIVTRSGTDAQPRFAFAFSNLKGAKGDSGEGIPPYPNGALVANALGVAEWLGPDGVDPTSYVGKVLTLKNVAETEYDPPVVIPQWEAAGGSGYAEMSIDCGTGLDSIGITLYNNNNTMSVSYSNYSGTIKGIPAKRRTLNFGRQENIEEGYKLDITGMYCYFEISGPVPLDYNLYIDLAARNNMVMANPDPNGSVIQFDDSTYFNGAGVCALEFTVDGQQKNFAAHYEVLKKDNASDTVRIRIYNPGFNLRATALSVRF